jgi:hypothetical protein
MAAERGRLQVDVFQDDERRSTEEKAIEMRMPAPSEAPVDPADKKP